MVPLAIENVAGVCGVWEGRHVGERAGGERELHVGRRSVNRHLIETAYSGRRDK